MTEAKKKTREMALLDMLDKKVLSASRSDLPAIEAWFRKAAKSIDWKVEMFKWLPASRALRMKHPTAKWDYHIKMGRWGAQ